MIDPMLFSNDPAVWLKDLLIDTGLGNSISAFLSTAILVCVVLLLSWLSNVITKFIIRKVVARIVRRTASVWDDILLEQKVFLRLSHYAPALVIWLMAGWALKEYPVWLLAVRKLTYIYMILIGMVVINTFIEAWHKIYLTLPVSQHRPIKGYVQVVKIFVIAITALIIISVVFRKEVSAVVAGLGAMAAVLMLIFKDPILGLVASIQLSVNKMMKIGDWISIPGRQVDGNVIDMTLTTVKVQNFDKSIITVPTYSLVSESFQNWIGMEESGVRQIKRSIMIDIRSISVAGKDLKEKYLAIPEISDFFDSIDKEYGIRKPVRDGSQDVTVSAGVTNLGLFRIYAETWLRKHPMIDSDQTIIVRHRPQAGDGLPLEIYAFCTRNSWIHYEHIQSEIFEHLFAVMPAFGLRVFQQPSGFDLLTLSDKNTENGT